MLERIAISALSLTFSTVVSRHLVGTNELPIDFQEMLPRCVNMCGKAPTRLPHLQIAQHWEMLAQGLRLHVFNNNVFLHDLGYVSSV
jgi:hypothetical protein